MPFADAHVVQIEHDAGVVETREWRGGAGPAPADGEQIGDIGTIDHGAPVEVRRRGAKRRHEAEDLG